jgi:glycosyltransferase involved in cell wall biosynthesis
MRIGIDARELCGHPTGVGRYLGGLLREWCIDARAERHQFVLYAHEPIGLALNSDRVTVRVLPGRGGIRWEQVTLRAGMARDRLDVLFAPAYTAPLFTGVPTVVTIHDASFAAHPEWFPPREGLRRRFFSRRAAAAARAVLTVSEFSRRELTAWLGVPPSKIHVIPSGIVPPAIGDAAPVKSPRLLYVGSIFNRRHVPDLVRAVALLAKTHPDVSLDIVGDNRSYPYQDVPALITAEHAGDRIRCHRYLPEAELLALYREARAFAFLSEYEGHGLTPLEALAVGVPPLLLDTAVAREVCGDAALYVPQGDITATADALRRLLFDEPTRQARLAAAPAVLARFSWPRAARETLAVLEGAA